MNITARPAIAALIVLAAALAAHAQPGGGPPPAQVVFDAAALQTVELRRDAIGQLRATATSLTAAQEEGFVDNVLIEIGDRVTKGQTIVQLDTTLIDLDIRRARAELDALNAVLAQRQASARFVNRDLQRVENLNERGSATEREVDSARTDSQTANAAVQETEANILRAQAELARLQERREDMTIRAPFDGSVVDKRTELGQWLSQGDVVAQLVRLDTIDVFVDVPERFISALYDDNASVNITIDALNTTFTSDEIAIVATADELARTFPVRIKLDNPQQAMKPGMSVTASIPTGAEDQRLTISKDAILRNDAGPFVYINQDGAASPRQVEILFATGDRFVIREGAIQPGTQIVTVGNERLFPTQPLIDVGNQPTADPPAQDDATASAR